MKKNEKYVKLCGGIKPIGLEGEKKMKKNEKYIKSCGGIKPEPPLKCLNGITELVFIIDRSGSMSGFEADTIGGFNSTIEKQKEGGGKGLRIHRSFR